MAHSPIIRVVMLAVEATQQTIYLVKFNICFLVFRLACRCQQKALVIGPGLIKLCSQRCEFDSLLVRIDSSCLILMLDLVVQCLQLSHSRPDRVIFVETMYMRCGLLINLLDKAGRWWYIVAQVFYGKFKIQEFIFTIPLLEFEAMLKLDAQFLDCIIKP